MYVKAVCTPWGGGGGGVHPVGGGVHPVGGGGAVCTPWGQCAKSTSCYKLV